MATANGQHGHQRRDTTMPLSDGQLQTLRNKLTNQTPYGEPPPPEAINLAPIAAAVTALSPEDRNALIQAAGDNYDVISTFIRGMNPYGEQPVMFPNLSVDDDEEYEDLAEWASRGVEVAGWLRKNYAGDAKEESDATMTLAQKHECFYWDFRFPDDPTPDGSGNVPKGGPMRNIQITKAIRIPFVYRQATSGQLLLGHLVIGYEGAGGM
jgi:hypothetical protein